MEGFVRMHETGYTRINYSLAISTSVCSTCSFDGVAYQAIGPSYQWVAHVSHPYVNKCVNDVAVHHRKGAGVRYDCELKGEEYGKSNRPCRD
jgi:hypothetical protein